MRHTSPLVACSTTPAAANSSHGRPRCSLWRFRRRWSASATTHSDGHPTNRRCRFRTAWKCPNTPLPTRLRQSQKSRKTLSPRPCHYEWVKSLSDQCRRHNVTFDFIETGTVFVKDGKSYRIQDKRMQSRQAYLSGLSFQGRTPHYKLRSAEGSLFDEPVAQCTGEFRDTCQTCGRASPATAAAIAALAMRSIPLCNNSA